MIINKLICGDCLDVLKDVPNEIFDLIIIDPPYNMKKDFPNDHMTPDKFKILLEKWVDIIVSKLKPNGSFYSFMGYDFRDYYKMLLSKHLIFKREIIWWYRRSGDIRNTQNYLAEHDKIFYFVKGKNYTFNKLRRKPSEGFVNRWKNSFDNTLHCIKWEKLTPSLKKKYKTKDNYLKKGGINIYKGKPLGNVLDIPIVHAQSNEKTGHPTQKPEKLIKIFIKVSSNEGDLVGDFFMGSGTTLAVAKKLRRKYFGIEITEKHYKVAKKRLNDIIIYHDILKYNKKN